MATLPCGCWDGNFPSMMDPPPVCLFHRTMSVAAKDLESRPPTTPTVPDHTLEGYRLELRARDVRLVERLDQLDTILDANAEVAALLGEAGEHDLLQEARTQVEVLRKIVARSRHARKATP